MRKILLLTSFFISGFVLFAQDLQYDAIAINIEVPVRVFKGDRFIDNLTIDDFEVYEEGKIQKIEAVYLIKKTDIEREESEIQKELARKKFFPELNRQFILIFELKYLVPEIESAIWYFMEKVIVPGDKLKVVTPRKTYDFKEESWNEVPRTEMANQLNRILRRDIFTRYKSWDDPNDYPAGEGDMSRELQYNYIGKRYLDENRLMGVAENLKKMPGQKNVFFFLQQELIEYPMPETSSSIEGIFRDLDFLDYMSTVAAYNFITPQKIKRAFADSSILFQFLYIKDKLYVGDNAFQPIRSPFDMMDTTSSIFSTLKDLSVATGGMAHTTINPEVTFKRAVEESENYYLLYYSPRNYVADGKFKDIRVEVKNWKYRINHRAGYIAD
jgi:VWFA-related protein